MDPISAIGAVASIVQLAGTALSLSKSLYEVSSVFASATDDIRSLAHDLAVFSETLMMLSKMLDGNAESYKASIYGLTTRIIVDCDAICKKIDKIIKKCQKMGRVGSKFKWMFSEKKIKILLERLRDMKINLLMILSTLQLDKHLSLMHIPSASTIESPRRESEIKLAGGSWQDSGPVQVPSVSSSLTSVIIPRLPSPFQTTALEKNASVAIMPGMVGAERILRQETSFESFKTCTSTMPPSASESMPPAADYTKTCNSAMCYDEEILSVPRYFPTPYSPHEMPRFDSGSLCMWLDWSSDEEPASNLELTAELNLNKRKDPVNGGKVCDLDNDLDNMEGILAHPSPLTPLDSSVENFAKLDEQKLDSEGPSDGRVAPDSWAVKKPVHDEVPTTPQAQLDASNLQQLQKQQQTLSQHKIQHQRSVSRKNVPAAPTTSQAPFHFGLSAGSPQGNPVFSDKPQSATRDNIQFQKTASGNASAITSPQIHKTSAPNSKRPDVAAPKSELQDAAPKLPTLNSPLHRPNGTHSHWEKRKAQDAHLQDDRNPDEDVKKRRGKRRQLDGASSLNNPLSNHPSDLSTRAYTIWLETRSNSHLPSCLKSNLLLSENHELSSEEWNGCILRFCTQNVWFAESDSQVIQVIEILKTVAKTVGFGTASILWAGIVCVVKDYAEKGDSYHPADTKVPLTPISVVHKATSELQVIASIVARYTVMENIYHGWNGMSLKPQFESELMDLCLHTLDYLDAALLPKHRLKSNQLQTNPRLAAKYKAVVDADERCRSFTLSIGTEPILEEARNIEEISSDDSDEGDDSHGSDGLSKENVLLSV